MILAYLTICVLPLQMCTPEKQVDMLQFDTEQECWDTVDDIMKHKVEFGPAVRFTFRCGEET